MGTGKISYNRKDYFNYVSDFNLFLTLPLEDTVYFILQGDEQNAEDW